MHKRSVSRTVYLEDNTRVYQTIPCLSFYYDYTYDAFNHIGNAPTANVADAMNGNWAGDDDTPSGNIRVRVNKYLECAEVVRGYLDEAVSNWGKTSADGVKYWVEPVKHTNVNRIIPLDVVLGKAGTGCTFPVEKYKPKDSSDFEATPIYVGEDTFYGVNVK